MKGTTPITPSGFTLVETLVAITVLTIALVGPYVMAQGTLQSSYIARDELTASALAQEGIEYVREVRDSNFVYATHHTSTLVWLAGLDGTAGGPNCYTATACWVDPSGGGTGTAFAGTCTTAACTDKPLYLSGSSIYTEDLTVSGATLTKYARSVKFTSVSAQETQVTVTVTWNNHGTHSVTLVENLQNWL